MNFSEPQKNIGQLDVREGDHIADFGAGSGAYSLALSNRVGPSGRVYAVDVQKDLLTKLKNEARQQHLFNIEIIWADLERGEGTALRGDSVDACIVSNLLFQVPAKESVAAEAWRILKPNGKVLVIDWNDSYGGLGPSPKEIFVKDAAKTLFLKQGFTYEKEIDAGGYHYGLIFRKK